MNLIKKTVANITDKIKGDNLKARCARGSLALGVGTIADKGLAFVSKLILARLLVPEELGLMVLILSLSMLFEAFTAVGIKHSIIQNKNGAKPEYLNTAWWFQCVRGIALYALAFLAAPWICRFYFDGRHDVINMHALPELITLVRVAFLSILFNGFVSPRAHVLEKEFRFGKAVFLLQGSAVLGTIITIVLTFTMRNVWAVVIGSVTMSVMRSVFSFVLCPFQPNINLDRDSLRQLFKFARGLFGSPMLTYIAFRIDVLVGGKMVTPSVLGMYGMAQALAMIPRELFAKVAAPVLLPAFANKQDDKKAICQAVLGIVATTAVLTIPWLALGVSCGDDILSIVYGSQFTAVALAFELICIVVFVIIQGVVLTSVFFAIGQPEKHRAFVGIRAIILVASIYPAIKWWGMTGAAAAVLVANLVALMVQVAIAHKVIGLSVMGYLKCWLGGTIAGILAWLFIQMFDVLLPDRVMLKLLASGVFCLLCCIVGIFFNKHLGFSGFVAVNNITEDNHA